MKKLFPTTLVGSYPQPDWLIDRAKLALDFMERCFSGGGIRDVEAKSARVSADAGHRRIELCA